MMGSNSLQNQLDICKDFVEGIEFFISEHIDALKKLELLVDDLHKYEDIKEYHQVFLQNLDYFKESVNRSIELLEIQQNDYTQCANDIVHAMEKIGLNVSFENNIKDGLVSYNVEIFNKRYKYE